MTVSRAGYETRDVSLRAVLLAGLAMFVAVSVFLLWMWWLLGTWNTEQAGRGPAAHPLARVGAETLPPAPRLQAVPRNDLLALGTWEEQMLKSYGWVDEKGAVVRIPIERAIALLAERGLPTRARDTAGTEGAEQ